LSVEITHFLPLIGPFIIGVENLRKEGYNVKTNDIISFPTFKANEKHIENNGYGKVHYVPADLKGQSIDVYKKYIKEAGFKTPDIVTAVPVCAGLSLLNSCASGSCSARGGEAAQNDWIYETTKYFLASGAKVLLLENAPGLIGKNGFIVLNHIRSILKDHDHGYKMHMTKTTSLRHGLPQDRKRTFLYVYKADNYKIFKQLDRHEPITLEAFMKEKARPEAYSDDIINHQTLKNTYSDTFFRLLNEIKLVDQFREESAEKEIMLKTAWQYLMPRYMDGTLNLDDFPKLKANADKNAYKLSIGKGYWDGSPLLIKGKSNAVISKNAFRTVHPYFNRYLSIREYMDLMGLPDDFVLEDQERSFNHICQSVPVNTGMDHILWAMGLVGGADTLSKKEFIDNTNAAFIQDNMKDKIETTFKIITPGFGEVKEVKNQKASFHELF